MSNGLWHTEDISNEATLLYHDKNLTGWNHSTAYGFRLIHR